jgi:hypothetical protein
MAAGRRRHREDGDAAGDEPGASAPGSCASHPRLLRT